MNIKIGYEHGANLNLINNINHLIKRKQFTIYVLTIVDNFSKLVKIKLECFH